VIPPVRRDLPTYRELIYPTLRAVASLGGSAQGAEITDALIELLKATPEQLAVTYDGRPKSVLIDRMDWARSYAKLGGALDSTRRGLFILSNLGKHVLSLPEEEGRAQVAQLDRDIRAARRRGGSDEGETDLGVGAADVEAGEDGAWREAQTSGSR
jgi:restriction system protein